MSAAESVAGAFSRLHPGVQQQLWAMKWTELRPIQVEAISAIMGSRDPVILSAATASGKTEAAFLPALSKIADEPTGSVRILYISPLKALINDQFRRVEELCSRLEMPVHRWHGDVSQSQKQKVIREPGGVLLITPESLESLFVNRSSDLSRVLGGVRYVVIDELHAFLDNCRGQHLRSLLSRLGAIRGGMQGLIGLSATLGDFGAAQRFLDRANPESVRVIKDTEGAREVKLKIHGYRERDLPPELLARVEENDPDLLGEYAIRVGQMVDLIRHAQGGSALVFANAKATVEECADLSQRIAEQSNQQVDVRVHHGSLSAELREDTEAVLKAGKPVITFCSSTLELGLDIGAVRMVGQIGPSWSVAAQRQRLGRSGRREGEPSILRIYADCRAAGDRSSLIERLQFPLIQSIAVTELMLEGWVEPAEPPVEDYSTLTHQIISVVSQTGGLKADQLFDRLCTRGAFSEIEPKRFSQLLRALGERDVLEQEAEGDLILGLKGEAIRKARDYYAVFPTPEEYQLLNEGRTLGTLELVPEVDEHLIFAGKRWRVSAIDTERMVVEVVRARGAKQPKFMGGGGGIHPRIVEKMRDVLFRGSVPSYLDQEAQTTLAEARAAFLEARLAEQILFPAGPATTIFFPWTGTRIHATLGALLIKGGFKIEAAQHAWIIKAGIDFVEAYAREITSVPIDPVALMGSSSATGSLPKYFWLVGDELGIRQLAHSRLDGEGTARWLRGSATMFKAIASSTSS